jgi:hypothetical protein
MSITYSDHQTSVLCPQCYAIPCRCSAFLLFLEAHIRHLEAYKRTLYNARQRELRGE